MFHIEEEGLFIHKYFSSTQIVWRKCIFKKVRLIMDVVKQEKLILLFFLMAFICLIYRKHIYVSAMILGQYLPYNSFVTQIFS